MMGRGMNGIEFGRVKIFAESEKLEEIARILDVVLKKHGYPEEPRIRDMKEDIETIMEEEGGDGEEKSEEDEEEMGVEDGEEEMGEDEKQKMREWLSGNEERSPWLKKK